MSKPPSDEAPQASPSELAKTVSAFQPDPSVLAAMKALQPNPSVLESLKGLQSLRIDPSILESFKGLQSLRLNPSILESFKGLQSLRLNPSILESFKELQSLHLDASVLEAMKGIQRTAEQMTSQAARVDASALAAAMDASLRSLQHDEAVQQRDTASAEAMAPRTPEEALFGWFRSLSPQMQSFILLVWLVWKLVGEPLEHAYVERWVTSSPESRPQTIVEINQYFGDEFPRSLRCVRGSGVNIRERPSTASPIIGRLMKGQAVAVFETAGGFSKIQYSDRDSDGIREGWAASGYLVGGAC